MSIPKYVRDAQNKYNSKFDLIQLKLPEGTKDRIKAIIGENGSMSAYCKKAVLTILGNDENLALNELNKIPLEQSEIPLESFQNENTDISTFSTDLPEIKRIKESEEMKKLEDNKPSNEYLDIPELTGDAAIDEANFVKFIHDQQERNAKKRNNELII